MIDTSHVDLAALAGVELRKRGRQLVGACPMCGGDDRFFIDTAKNAWGCRNCTGGSYRDALHLVAMRDGLDLHTSDGFKAACETLRLPVDAQPTADQRERPPQQRTPHLRTDYEAQSPGWQRGANKFITDSVGELYRAPQMLDYLRGRGIEQSLIEWLEIGFNDRAQNQVWGTTKVYLPQGIVIPWERFNSVHTYSRVRIRTGGNPKYVQAAGAENGLYVTRPVKANSFVVLCEGELDAISLASAMIRYEASTGNRGVRRVVPVATGGTTQGRVLGNVVMLSAAQRTLIAFDNDENAAGDSGAAWWLDRLKGKARRWKPTAHDVNDMVVRDGHKVIDWVREGLQS